MEEKWDIVITNHSILFNIDFKELWRLMYATPVIYPLSILKESHPQYLWMLLINPLISIIETFKFAFSGVGMFCWGYLLYIFVVIAFLFIWGLLVFNRVQRNFMDVI